MKNNTAELNIKPAALLGLLALSAVMLSVSLTSCFSLSTTRATPVSTTTVVEKTQNHGPLTAPTTTTTTRSTTY